MMDSCLAGKPERVGPVEVDDIRKDLLTDFSALPTQQERLQAQTENLQVYLRIRPFTSTESDNGESQECVTMEGSHTVVLKAPRTCQSSRQSEKPLPQTAQRFTFTQVFGPDSSQRRVFEGSVRGLVRDVLDGGNCLVFTYGVTNAGKTFTFLGPEHDSGLLPRSLAVIFSSLEGRLYGGCDLKPTRCRDVSRLSREQQQQESSRKSSLLRLLKESDSRGLSLCRSTSLEGSSLSDSSVSSVSEDSFSLDVGSDTSFSVWVSFCEIYNDNIHDLLEQVPSGTHRRTVLRLSQDVKGNSFVKDLRWVQVSSSEEAHKLVRIGRRNQSFSSTRLNQLSSRSHSIFSIRILRVQDAQPPRILGVSELALCDLAGSERCSRTQNRGERLKEAGNINSSLLTLGKCINAMRLNQHSKFQHHVPFRESKLTHFLQFFFCGAGRVSMVVNINQCSSSFDETLNVLKFSALAQKVVVLSSRSVAPGDATRRSAREVSMIINEADRRRNLLGRGRKSSLVAWETSLEDVQEDEDEEEDEEEEEEEEESVMEGTVLEAGGDGEKTALEAADRESELRLLLESQIREEVSAEFMELFNKMERDYSERLEKERELLEDKAEKRLEILRNLVSKTVDLSHINTEDSKEQQAAMLEGIISSVSEDLQRIRQDAQTVHRCLAEQTHTAELEALRLEKQQSHDQLQEAQQALELQSHKLSELMEICQQKDGVIGKLQAAMDRTVEDATRDRVQVESIRKELMELQQTCRCLKTRGGGAEREEEEEGRKRRSDALEENEGGPARKRVVLEEEIWRLQEENDKKEEAICQLRGEREERSRLQEELRRREEEQQEELKRREEELRRREEELQEELKRREEELQEELKRREEELQVELTKREEDKSKLEEELRRRGEEVEELKKQQALLEQSVEKLSADVEDQCSDSDALLASLEAEQRETSRLSKENKALVNGIFQLQTEVTGLQTQLTQQTGRADSLSEQLDTAKARLQDLESQSEETSKTVDSLQQEVDALRQEADALRQEAEQLRQEADAVRQDVKEEEPQSSGVFHAAIEELRKESRAALERSALKSQQVENLQRDKTQLEKTLTDRESECTQLREELANQRAEVSAGRAESDALRERLERVQQELRGALSQQEQLAEDRRRQVEALSQELERTREAGLQRREEEEEEEEEGRKVSVVEELKEEIQKLQERRERRGRQEEEEQGEEEEERGREFEAVRREVERLQTLNTNTQSARSGQEVVLSPLQPNELKTKTPRSTRRKRKSSDMEDLVHSENKRNRARGTSRAKNQEKKDGTLQKIGELIHSSPSILGSKAKTIIGLVSGRSVEKEAVTVATKPRRGRRKLFKTDAAAQLIDSPLLVMGGAEEEKESDHVIIRRQLRSKTCRK